jgi:SAM-dependent methyltransferase
MQDQKYEILNEVEKYYSYKIRNYGDTPKGVDWNGRESQFLRFEQLCKVIDFSKDFSINDLGCGYGALFDYMMSRYSNFNYHGIDVSEEMIEKAKLRNFHNERADFIKASSPKNIADYGIASGIFNVRLDIPIEEWQKYIIETIEVLNATSRRGFAFNCLTSYSDKDKMRDYLYYADPCKIFDTCKRHYSKHIALLHDYGLYEFTILVRKS